MKIYSIQPNYYSNVNNRKSNKPINNTYLGFNGYRENFAKAIIDASNTDLKYFSSNNCKKNSYGMFKSLINALEEFPNTCRKKGFDIVRNSIKFSDTVDCAIRTIESSSAGIELINRSRVAANRGEGVTLVEENGKPLLACYNFGKYDKGLFFKTKHEQIVFEFKDPNNGKFVGFSIAKDGGVAITRNSGRDEIYPEPYYHYRAHSKEGYDATVYDEVYPKGYLPPYIKEFNEWFYNRNK